MDAHFFPLRWRNLLLVSLLVLGCSTGFSQVRLNAPHTEPIPPKWMFGYIQSQWGDNFGYGYQASFLDHARALRGLDNQYGHHQHPADVMVLDMFWDGLNWNWPPNMIWDNGRFPNPKQMMDDLHAMHFKIIMNYHDSGFGSDWLNCMRGDFSKGLDAPWLDFWTGGSSHESAVWDLMKSLRGTDKRLALMARHFARPNLRNHEGNNGNGLGIVKVPDEDEIEKTMPVHWTGDVEGSWGGFKESIEGVVYSTDGAAGGWSYLHTDTPGHSGGDDPELAARWIQFSDFTTTTRNHGWMGRDVWSWGPELEKISFDSRMLRYRLLPYIYRSAWEIWENAMPMTRPMPVAYPGEADGLKYQYLFGDSLLVAPVYQKAADFPGGTMPVYLPRNSDWINYWTRSVSAGGQTINVTVNDRAHIPLFVKRGAIIPMGPEIYWIDPTQHANPITLDIYPLASGTSSSSIYDDDGESFGYQRGEKSFTAVSVTRSSQAISVKVGSSNGTYTGKPSTQTYILKVNLVDGAYGSVLNGNVVFTKLADAATILAATAPDNSWALDAAAGVVYARFSTSTSVANEIVFNAGNGDYLGLDKSNIPLAVAGGSASAAVAANVSWTVANPASSWLAVAPTSGSGNGTLTFQAASNPALTVRTATVTLSGAGKSASVTLTQAGLASENIAKGKPVTASSVESSQVPIANAVDDNTTTRWASASSDPQWIAIDLGAVYQIAKVELLWEAAYAKSYKIQVSMDNATWADIYSTTNGQGGTESLLVSGMAHYIRMYGTVRATAYGYSLWEFRVFGAVENPNSLDVTPSSLSFTSVGGSSPVALASNVAWNVSNVPAWLTVTPLSGSSNGTLSFTAAANTGLARTATVNIQGGGITRSVGVSQAALPNTPPTIAAIADQSIFVNTATGAIPFIIADAETPVANLTLLASSDTPSLIPASQIVFGGSGANRTVTVTPVAGQAGIAIVGIQVSDANGGTASIQFNVTVRDANVILDRNGDGISDVWAALYPTAGAPSADPDSDGISNLAEAQAGTDPTNPSSRFVATAGPDAAGNIVVRWLSVSGKYYFVESSTDLAIWTMLPGEYSGTGSMIAAIVRPAGTVAGPRTFWHVVVFDMDSTGSGLNDWEKTHADKVATITSTAGANGRISPAGRSYLAKGGSLTFTVTPATGYAIDQVQVDGQSVGAVITYPFTSVTADHTIGATFKSNSSLSAYPKQLSFATGAGVAAVTVTSDSAWTATSNQPWLSVAPAGASGNGTLTLTAQANASVERTATVTLQGVGGTQQIPVYQAGLPTVRIRNRWKNTYMYDAGDRVGYGATPTDDTYRWIVEDLGNGQKELRNVGTGEYINIENHQDWAQCTPRLTTWMSSRWTLEDTGDGYIRFKSAWMTNNYLHVENQTGYVQQGAACAACQSYQWVLEPISSDYGSYFSKKAYVSVALPTYSVDRTRLPNPILGSNQNWIDMYWKCWEIAFRGLRQPVAGSPLVSNWLDEAFSGDIFQWDTIFMMMFARYGHDVFPAIQSLDNFYARQLRSGYICRELRESDGALIHFDFNGGLFAATGWKNTINPPLFSWAEVESYRITGDKSRFAMILPVLEKYSEWLNRDGDPDAADWESNGRLSAGTVHRLFWNTPLGSGMDNTPRPAGKGAGWVEMSSQMVIMYNNMATICDELGKTAEAVYFRAQAADISSRINQWCWNEADGFYYDVLANGQQFKKKTIGGFWPLLAGVPSAAQAAKLVAHLQNPNEFWRLNVFPSLSADEPEYASDGLGGYWLGGVWAPTNVMVIKGLERYGYEDVAAAATEKYLAGMAEVFRTTNTVYENYAPDRYSPGNPAAADFVGWTGCGPIQLLFEQVMGLRPDGIRNALTWRLRRTDRHGVEHLKLGSNTVSVVCEARASATAPAVLTVQCQNAFQLTVVHPSLGTKVFNVDAGTHSLTVQ